MANATVSPAEVERFKIEKVAEREFCGRLQELVTEYRSKVSPKNSVLRSMERFLKANV